ncbi:MAG: hypothetical protein JW720_09300 [Sedimentisphaerales bacterium]|nr:hypothetical protein [Sedimentisphaerales bacterium]
MKTKLLLVFLALFVCLPAIFLEYGMHDDYRYLGAGISKKDIWRLHPDMQPGVVMGRPVAMFFIGIQSLVTNEIRDFTWQRLVFFGSTLLCALCVYYYLTRRLLLDSVFAACLAFCIFALPQSQLFIIWSVWSVFAGPALLLTIFSYLVFDYAWNKFFLTRRWKPYAIYLFASFCLFLVSLYNYPVMSLFFVVFTCANILFSGLSQWPRTRVRVIHEVLFCCLGMGVYLLSYKIIYLPLVLSAWPDLQTHSSALGYHKVSLSPDIALTAKQFYIGSILSLGGVFHPLFGSISALCMLLYLSAGSVVVFVGSLFCKFHSKTTENITLLNRLNRTWQMLLAVVIIIPLSIAPVLASGVSLSYRVVFPYSAMIVLLMFWVLRGLCNLMSIKRVKAAANWAALFAVLVFGILAHLCMSNTALSANRELTFVRQKLASVDFSTVNMLLCEKPFDRPAAQFKGTLIREIPGYPVFGQLRQRYEYDHMATNRRFVSELFQAVLAEMDIQRSIPINPYEQNLYHSSGKTYGAYVVNMNEIVTPIPGCDSSGQISDRPMENIGASQFVLFELSAQADGWNILDFYPNFWEETCEYPHWVSLELNEPRICTEYALQTGPYGRDDTGRMPQEWLLQGSDDGEKWVDLDQRADQTDWKNNERRPYKTAPPAAFKHYRFYCTKGNNPGIFRLNKLELKLSERMPE